MRNPMQQKLLNCPILKQEIEEGYCFEISMVAENLVKSRTLPEEIQKVVDFKQICLSCKNHRFD